MPYAKPLSGLCVVEMNAIGPVPFGTMLLSDFGADVIRVDRVTPSEQDWQQRALLGGRRSIGLDLKEPRGKGILRELIRRADILVDGFRPGVMERLGFGDEACLRWNPRLVITHVNGFGTSGSWSPRAGHDINYTGLSGILNAIGHPDLPPPPPLNVVADYGGGAMYLVFGVLAALIERTRSGRGQVVDISITAAATSLATLFHDHARRGLWNVGRGTNVLDGGAPYYSTYRTKDNKFVAVGALEPEFYKEFLMKLDLDADEWPQHDRDGWSRLRRTLVELFSKRTRTEWEEVFAGSDACVTPVLDFSEVADYAAAFMGSQDERGGRHVVPRLSRTPGERQPAKMESAVEAILSELGRTAEEITLLRRDRIVAG